MTLRLGRLAIELRLGRHAIELRLGRLAIERAMLCMALARRWPGNGQPAGHRRAGSGRRDTLRLARAGSGQRHN